MYNFKRLKKTFIVAEIGNNHEGNFDIAIRLINEAKKCGVDAVKFQTFETEYFVNKSEKKRFKKLKKFELKKDEFKRLAFYAKKKGLKFISTPLDINSAKYLSKIVDIFKISSGDNNYDELIELCASYKKPLIISTGLLNLLEINKIFTKLKKLNFPKNKLSFLHCVSDYPVNDKDSNLMSIKFLNDKLPLIIGYSDHVIGFESCIVAVSLGAKILEKHFTLDNNFSKFRDHKISLNPNDMKNMVKKIRRVEQMFGDYNKKATKNEIKNLNSMRRSLYFNKSLEKGTILKKEHLKIVRPFKKLQPNDLKKFIGQKLKKSVKASGILTVNLIS